ncbi:MAG: hypothetical protein ABIL18_07220 [candidate division WOR-3 bacterium]
MKNKTISIMLICAVMMAVTLCSQKQPAQTVTGEFKITNLVICAEEPTEYMKYKEQPNATYKPGDVVWIYMNLPNVKYNTNPDGSYQIHIPEHLVVKSPKGEILLDLDLLPEPLSFPKERDMTQVYLTNNINTISDLEDGEYQVNITVSDKLSGKATSITTKFILKK